MEHGAISLLTSEFHSPHIETSTLIKYREYLESIITKMHVEIPLQIYAKYDTMGSPRKKKPIFHAKMGSIKDRNGMDLTGAEDTMKRW